jgi:hypothetical protein
MSVRETLNSKPSLTVAFAAALVLGCGWLVFHQLRPAPEPPPIGVFYTDDDGTTWFTDSPTHTSPFDHNGKEAVRCCVFTAGSKSFVGYMRKMTPELMHRYQANMGSTDAELAAGTLVKRPGDKEWVPMSDPRSQSVTHPTAPGGSGDVTEVEP